MTVRLRDLVAGPGIETIWLLLVVNHDINPIRSVVVVDEAVDSLLEQNPRAVSEPTEVPASQPVDREVNRITATHLRNLPLVALSDGSRCTRRNVRQQEPPRRHTRRDESKKQDQQDSAFPVRTPMYCLLTGWLLLQCHAWHYSCLVSPNNSCKPIKCGRLTFQCDCLAWRPRSSTSASCWFSNSIIAPHVDSRRLS